MKETLVSKVKETANKSAKYVVTRVWGEEVGRDFGDYSLRQFANKYPDKVTDVIAVTGFTLLSAVLIYESFADKI